MKKCIANILPFHHKSNKEWLAIFLCTLTSTIFVALFIQEP